MTVTLSWYHSDGVNSPYRVIEETFPTEEQAEKYLSYTGIFDKSLLTIYNSETKSFKYLT